MGFFEENKALIITVLLFAVLLLSMYNITLSDSNRKVRETLIELNELRPPQPQEQEEEQPREEPEQQQRPNLETHQAYNQNQEESQSTVQSRLDEIFQKNAAEQEASDEESSDPAAGEYQLEENNSEQRQQESEGDNTSEETSVKPGTLRNSSISFSLLGRSAVDIPNPIYTCESSGKVVVNITVNANGMVRSTSINKASSTTSNECLMEQAQEYAKNAVFSNLPGRDSQPGTITYSFQGQ